MTLSEQHLEEAWKKFEDMDWEETWSISQECFEPLTLVRRDTVRAELIDNIEGLGQWPFAQVNTMLVVLGYGAMREGARLMASISGPAKPTAALDQVDFGRLWTAALDTSRPTTKVHKELRDLLEEHPQIEALIGAGGRGMVDKLIAKYEKLGPHREFLERTLFGNMFHGVRVEFLVPKLIADAKRERELLGQAVSTLSLQREDAAWLTGRLKIRRNSGPWPRDMMCSCGNDLRGCLVCCDPDAPMDPEAIARQVSEDFLLVTDCCGAQLTGFRCSSCGHLHTWAKGVVPSLSQT